MLNIACLTIEYFWLFNQIVVCSKTCPSSWLCTVNFDDQNNELYLLLGLKLFTNVYLIVCSWILFCSVFIYLFICQFKCILIYFICSFTLLGLFIYSYLFINSPITVTIVFVIYSSFLGGGVRNIKLGCEQVCVKSGAHSSRIHSHYWPAFIYLYSLFVCIVCLK